MSKNHKADSHNANEGTSATNDTYQSQLDNRANQLNPNNEEYKGE